MKTAVINGITVTTEADDSNGLHEEVPCRRCALYVNHHCKGNHEIEEEVFGSGCIDGGWHYVGVKHASQA
jgi:hypothetical protein